MKLLCSLNYGATAPAARGAFDHVESWEMERQTAVEAEARKLIAAGREADAAKLLQHFVDENAARLESEYHKLNETLPGILKKAGVRYLFADYMREWAGKTGVPLP